MRSPHLQLHSHLGSGGAGVASANEPNLINMALTTVGAGRVSVSIQQSVDYMSPNLESHRDRRSADPKLAPVRSVLGRPVSPQEAGELFGQLGGLAHLAVHPPETVRGTLVDRDLRLHSCRPQPFGIGQPLVT